MKKLGLLAALGAAVGSVLRYEVGQVITPDNFPLATFTVNIIGSFLIGLLLGLPVIAKNDSRRVFLITGVLGGFTTFSALAVETLNLEPQIAILYLFVSFTTGLIAVILGHKLALANS